MRALAPLVRLLQRSLRAMLLRRGLIWAACALLLIVPGGALSQLFENGRVLRLGLILAALSALPAFLLWPPPERLLTDRLRRIDEETVFEACLEAEPGPVRDILRRLAAERASALPFLPPPREPLWRGLGVLWAAALACLVLVEGGSFLLLGHSLTLAPESSAQVEGGQRIEEEGFSDFATEDPSARRARRKQAPEQEAGGGENPALGSPGESSGRAASSKAPSSVGERPSQGSPGNDAIAKRRQGEREDAVSGSSPFAVPAGTDAEGHRESSAATDRLEQAGMTPREGTEPAGPGTPPMPGRTGLGYEHTADTKVPSPLLDYRSRFEARYAERTGGHLAASGRMGFGDLRAFQRRYFESFTLKADVGTADDPYVAQLKRRWNDVKGGLR